MMHVVPIKGVLGESSLSVGTENVCGKLASTQHQRPCSGETETNELQVTGSMRPQKADGTRQTPDKEKAGSQRAVVRGDWV